MARVFAGICRACDGACSIRTWISQPWCGCSRLREGGHITAWRLYSIVQHRSASLSIAQHLAQHRAASCRIVPHRSATLMPPSPLFLPHLTHLPSSPPHCVTDARWQWLCALCASVIWHHQLTVRCQYHISAELSYMSHPPLSVFPRFIFSDMCCCELRSRYYDTAHIGTGMFT